MHETFSDWCFNNHQLIKGPIGDFAHDWAHDDTAPGDPKNFEEITDYLYTLSPLPCQGAMEAAPLAWAQYQETGNQ